MRVNAKMIKIARQTRSMSLATLSESSGIDTAILSKIETGLVSVNEDQINKLSKALKYPPRFFGREISEARYSDFFYRKRVTMPVKEKSKIDSQIEVLRIVYDELTSAADMPDPRTFNVSPRKGMSPESIANMARDFYGISKGPLLNLVNILEKNGVAVIYLDSESEKFDGLTTYTEKGFPLIIINKNKPNDRKRFTLAHELGHIIMHFPFRFENDFYDRIKENDKDNIFESEADRFASEFLMPSSDIFEDLQGLTYSRLGILKQYWNVSKSSIVRKAKTLGCIDEKKYSFLLIELSRNGERKVETGGITIDEPQLFRKLFEMHKQLGYSEDQLANHLYISVSDLRNTITIHNGNKLRIIE